MIDKKLVFIAGHHRSGTSLLHEIIRDHESVCGFTETGVPEDEGQHLQSVYKPAHAFGGLGKYIYDAESYMNEDHPLATEKSANEIMREWSKHYGTECEYYIEKSPPNLVRTRFLQRLFPNSKFIIILRHPLAVAYATQKWSNTSIESLVEHTLRGYEILAEDISYLNSAFVLRYEDFVQNPQNEVNKIYKFIGIDSRPLQHEIKPDVNDKYFALWRHSTEFLGNRESNKFGVEMESRAKKFGYSIEKYDTLLPCPLMAAHDRKNR